MVRVRKNKDVIKVKDEFQIRRPRIPESIDKAEEIIRTKDQEIKVFKKEKRVLSKF